MNWTQIFLRLARNPGYPDGDRQQGYIITAPLDADGRIILDEWRKARDRCTVVRFKPGDEKDADGRLTHNGSHWCFHYDEDREGADEAVYRLSDHSLAVGNYVTVHEGDGRDLTYRVDEHAVLRPLHNQPGKSKEHSK